MSGATNYADEVHYVELPAAYIAALEISLQGRLGELEGEYGCVLLRPFRRSRRTAGAYTPARHRDVMQSVFELATMR